MASSVNCMLVLGFTFMMLVNNIVLGTEHNRDMNFNGRNLYKSVKASIQQMATLGIGCDGVDAGDANITCEHEKLERRFGPGLDCTEKVPVRTRVSFVSCPPGYALAETYKTITCKFPGRWDNEMFTCDEIPTEEPTTKTTTTTKKPTTAKLTTKPTTKKITTTKRNPNITATTTTLVYTNSTTPTTPTGTTIPVNTAAANSTNQTITTVSNSITNNTAVPTNTTSTETTVVTTTTNITTTTTTIAGITNAITTSPLTPPTTTKVDIITAPTTTITTPATTTLATTTTTTTTTTQATTTTQPPGLQNGYGYTFENTTFKRYIIVTSPYKARKTCSDDGAKVTIFSTQAKLTHLITISYPMTAFTVGITYNTTAGVYFTDDGSPMPTFINISTRIAAIEKDYFCVRYSIVPEGAFNVTGLRSQNCTAEYNRLIICEKQLYG